ncbi:MAG: DUF45 domain-containing protein [Lachnoclostridium sp.]|jgi:predicted metal-dependent hydrolase
MTETIKLGERTISYEIVRKKVKNINLHIKADGRVYVSANKRVSKKYIEDFLLQKADWIEKNLKKIESQKANAIRTIIPTEEQKIKLLGSDYQISIRKADENYIEVQSRDIHIYTRNPDDSHKIQLLWNKWFTALVKEVFEKAVEKIYPAFEPYQVPFPFIKIRKMKSLWGSCSMYKGTITLNRALIHAPFECIEYVAAHELTHFLYPNHSSHFYNRLSSIMPDYKERKKLLNQQGIYQ